jgi:hypothetical protein
VRFPATARFGGHIDLLFHPAIAPYFRAVAAVMLKYLYLFAEPAGGSAVCRAITGGSRTSLHAHGVCFDINPSKNQYSHSAGPIQWGRQTDMDPKMIRDIEAIKSLSGRKAIEWGGRWTNIKDPMHFEIDLLRTDAESGLSTATVAGWDRYLAWTQGDDMTPFYVELERMVVDSGGNARSLFYTLELLRQLGDNLGIPANQPQAIADAITAEPSTDSHTHVTGTPI